MNSWRRDVHGTGVLAMTTLSDVEWGPVQIDRSLEGAAHVPVLTGDRRKRVESLFLAVDLGGTHARVGLVAAGDAGEPPVILAYETYRCVAYPSLSDILSSFRSTHHVHSCALVLACAGYVEQGAVINDNLAWPVIPEMLRIEGGFTTVAVLNDFEAFAHAIGHIDRQHMTMIAEGISDPRGPIAVVGPGTGLGAALWLPGTPVRVLHSEAGQMELAARPGVEQAIRAELGPEDGYVAYEHVLSGPGLLRLYRALGVVRGCSTPLSDPSAISAAALAGTDPFAVEAVDFFCRWLGAFCGDVAVAFGASGGVCLAGGFLAQLVSVLRAGPFMERFLDKGVMRSFLMSTPVFVVEHGQLGVLGAATWQSRR